MPALAGSIVCLLRPTRTATGIEPGDKLQSSKACGASVSVCILSEAGLVAQGQFPPKKLKNHTLTYTNLN